MSGACVIFYRCRSLVTMSARMVVQQHIVPTTDPSATRSNTGYRVARHLYQNKDRLAFFASTRSEPIIVRWGSIIPLRQLSGCRSFFVLFPIDFPEYPARYEPCFSKGTKIFTRFPTCSVAGFSLGNDGCRGPISLISLYCWSASRFSSSTNVAGGLKLSCPLATS